jgi:hypothetical protein
VLQRCWPERLKRLVPRGIDGGILLQIMGQTDKYQIRPDSFMQFHRLIPLWKPTDMPPTTARLIDVLDGSSERPARSANVSSRKTIELT